MILTYYCAFHYFPDILVSKETLNNDDIPSPKIDPVLITAADDTDGELAYQI